MIKRSTWVTVALLAVFALIAWYLQQPGNLLSKTFIPATPTTEIPGMLISASDIPIKRISIQSAGGQSIALEQQNDLWMLTLGHEAQQPADPTAAEQAASQVQGIRIVVKIKPATDLAAFGLDKPAYTLQLTLAKDKLVTFKIGNVTVTDSGYYVQDENGLITVVEKRGLEVLINLLNEPPYLYPPTPSPVPASETPTATPTIEATPLPGTPEPLTESTPTKQP